MYKMAQITYHSINLQTQVSSHQTTTIERVMWILEVMSHRISFHSVFCFQSVNSWHVYDYLHFFQRKYNILFIFYTLTPTEPHQSSPNYNFLYFLLLLVFILCIRNHCLIQNHEYFCPCFLLRFFFFSFTPYNCLLIHCMLFFCLW